MELAIVMYHYVRDVRTPFPGIHALPVAEFRKHIAHLAERYSFVGARDVLAALRGERALPERSCLLTFDDGVRDHADTVFPILREKGIPGLFFLITSAQEEGRVLDAHKMHHVLAHFGIERVIFEFRAFVARTCPERAEELRIDDRERKSPSRYDDVLTGNLKTTVNRLDDPTRAAFLGELFSRTFGDERSFARDLYLSWDDANRMIDGGVEIASHSHTHRHLTLLSQDERERDLVRARDLLVERTDDRALPALAYPFGPYDDALLDLARRLGYTLGFTVDVGINASLDDPLRLKRINANDVLTIL